MRVRGGRLLGGGGVMALAAMVIAGLLVVAPSPARGHGAMLVPPPRNAIDSELPGKNWGSGATHTGRIEPLGVQCENGTAPCKPGQAVFWFSQGD